MGRKLIDLTGQRFGRLVAIEHPFLANIWTCRCDCGNVTKATGWALRKQIVQSCGCLNSEASAARKRTHGLSGTPEYITWNAAKGRCNNPENGKWSDYGGRGIRVCKEWTDDFQQFLSDVGRRPTPRHTLDRRDVNGHYEPGNVRWATPLQQANNTRANVKITANGRTQTIAEWARELRISDKILYDRIQVEGWDPHEALSTPKLPSRKGRPNRHR